jgi:3D (Asp-Asp-Asp) domain-containing protein
MRIISAILKGLLNGGKSVKKGIKLGQRLSKGVEELKSQGKSFVKKLKMVGIILAVLIVLCYTPILIVMESTQMLVDNVSGVINKITSFEKKIENWITGSSDKQKEDFNSETGINPDKIKTYIKTQDESYPRSANVKMDVITDVDGKKSTSKKDYTVDLSMSAEPFKIPYEFLLTADRVADETGDLKNTAIVDSANKYLKPTYQWAYDKYTKDVSDSTKNWTEKTSFVSAKTKKVTTYKYVTRTETHYETQMQTQIRTRTETRMEKRVTVKTVRVIDDTELMLWHYVTVEVVEEVPVQYEVQYEVQVPVQVPVMVSVVDTISETHDEVVPIKDDEKKIDKSQPSTTTITAKYPLPFLTEASNAFKECTYQYKEDVTTEDNPWSNDIVVSSQTNKTVENYTEADGTTGQKTITTVTKQYKKVKRTVVEDVLLNEVTTIKPQGVTSFLDEAGLAESDLQLIHDAMAEIPETSDLTGELQNIIDGRYNSGATGDTGIANPIDLTGNYMNHIIPVFIQWADYWGDKPYGDHNTIGKGGCGPTSMAMVATGLSGNYNSIDLNHDGVLDPFETATWSAQNGYRVSDGTDWSFFPAIAKKIGLNCRNYPEGSNAVYDELKRGNAVIASMYPGHFTTTGHFIVLTGLDANGDVIVNDPNHPNLCGKSFSWEQIIKPEGHGFWAFDNPNLSNINIPNTTKTDFQATAYDLTYESCGKYPNDSGYGVTASGISLKGKDLRDRCIAVDTRIIPLGSKVYIDGSKLPVDMRIQTMPDGTKVNMTGVWTAVDTGGAIKGNIIDLYFGGSDYDPANLQKYKSLITNWGRRNIVLYVPNK